MKTIRRLYFYLVALISLEVVIWGVINLMRTIFASGLTFPGADTLAQALALIFVGIPIFAIHWLWAQRSSTKDPEELSSLLRASFLYGTLLATGIPAISNLLALMNRSLILSAGIPSYRAFLGGSQSWIDNIIAIALNLITASYFYNILMHSWKEISERENYANIRRLYRYIWMLLGLLMLVLGIQQNIRFLLYQPASILGAQNREMYINGLSLILVGTPIWLYMWNLIQVTVREKLETYSSLRLGILYLLSLGGVITVLTTAGFTFHTILMQLLGANIPFAEFISRIGGPVSVGIPLAAVWAYYGGWLNQEINSYNEIVRRAGMKRLYYYILSFIGLVTAFVGLALLVSFVIEIIAGHAIWGETLRPRLSAAIATLISGLPLWLVTWRLMQSEAGNEDEMGDHARNSLVRRTYLYLAIFACVIGGMVSAIMLIYTILFGILDHRSDSFIQDILNRTQLLILFASFLAYHWITLRNDGSHRVEALSSRQARFTVIIFEAQDSGFARPILQAIQQISSSIPVAIQSLEAGLPEETSEVQAVIIPSSLAIDPPEALRLWLKNFSGQKLIAPVKMEKWYWPGPAFEQSNKIIAQAVKQMSEGQNVKPSGGVSAIQIVAYVLAALFGIQLLFVLITLAVSVITGN